jgi:hypothetical protein
MPCVQPRALYQQTRQHAPRAVHRNWHLAARQCRGDPVGRPLGAPHARRAPGMMRLQDDSNDPHPALRAGLSLPGRGVSLLLRWKQPGASCRFAQPSRPLSAPSGAERVRVRWGPNHRTATHRVAAACRAYSRVRYTNEHGAVADLPVVGAVREPPLQCPAMSVVQTCCCAPACMPPNQKGVE